MKNFKTLIINTCDLIGGASLAADRLHTSLNDAGYETHMLVHIRNKGLPLTVSAETKMGTELTKLRSGLDALSLRLYPSRQTHPFTTAWLPDFKDKLIRKVKPDVINIHWMGSGGLSIEHLKKFHTPVFMTLHDSWSFTGGCHYHFDCHGYIQKCGRCPILQSEHAWDLSRINWKRKKSAYKNLPLEIISPSRWLADCSQQSSLMAERPHHVIPNGIDHHRFKPVAKTQARSILGLPMDKKLVLFRSQGAGFPKSYKGGHLLPVIFKKLAASSLGKDIELVSFGSKGSQEELQRFFPTHQMGFLGDAISLSLLYSACDIMIMPSIQENFPLTILESLACGTPVTAFATGGIPEIITKGEDGHLAVLEDCDDFVQGTLEILRMSNPAVITMSACCRQKIEKYFTLEKQAAKHAALFSESLKRFSQK